VGVVVGPLDLTDVDTLVALHAIQRAAYRAEEALIRAPIPLVQEPLSVLRDRGLRFLGYSQDGRLRGAVGFVVEGEVLDIHRLVVDPAHHRRGIGRALLAALPAAASVTVTAAAANGPGLALYAGAGFRHVGERVVGGGVRVVDLRRP